MLPFLKVKNESGIASTIMKNRTPDEKPKENQEDTEDTSHEASAQAVLDAIKAGDAKALSMALKDAFELMDSEPHIEGEHVSPHSYDAQNIKAGK